MDAEPGHLTCAPLHLGSGVTGVGPKPCEVAVRDATSVSGAKYVNHVSALPTATDVSES